MTNQQLTAECSISGADRAHQLAERPNNMERTMNVHEALNQLQAMSSGAIESEAIDVSIIKKIDGKITRLPFAKFDQLGCAEFVKLVAEFDSPSEEELAADDWKITSSSKRLMFLRDAVSGAEAIKKADELYVRLWGPKPEASGTETGAA